MASMTASRVLGPQSSARGSQRRETAVRRGPRAAVGLTMGGAYPAFPEGGRMAGSLGRLFAELRRRRVWRVLIVYAHRRLAGDPGRRHRAAEPAPARLDRHPGRSRSSCSGCRSRSRWRGCSMPARAGWNARRRCRPSQRPSCRTAATPTPPTPHRGCRRGAAASRRRSRQPASPAPRTAPSDDGRRTIAVLPFVNMSGDAENEYFSDGIAEEILNLLAQAAAAEGRLAHVRRSPTRARTSRSPTSRASSASARCSKAACARPATACASPRS